MKKAIPIFMAFILLFLLTACNPIQPSSPDGGDQKDNSENQSGDIGGNGGNGAEDSENESNVPENTIFGYGVPASIIYNPGDDIITEPEVYKLLQALFTLSPSITNDTAAEKNCAPRLAPTRLTPLRIPKSELFPMIFLFLLTLTETRSPTQRSRS